MQPCNPFAPVRSPLGYWSPLSSDFWAPEGGIEDEHENEDDKTFNYQLSTLVVAFRWHWR
jgi:hypothetical protein